MFTGYPIERENRRRLKAESQKLQFRLRDFDGPRTVNHATWLRRENQGPMGSCRGWCRSTNAEISYYLATGRVEQFSALWCYLKAQERDGLLGADNGATIESGAVSGMEDGHAFERTAPYPNPVRYTTELPRAAAAEALKFRCRSRTHLPTHATIAAFVLGRCGGVDYGGPWPLPIGRDRVMRHCNSVGPHGHAWAIVGAVHPDDVDEFFDLMNLPRVQVPNEGRHHLVGFNQHNNDGPFLIMPRAADTLLRHPHSVAVGLSPMSVPEPAPYDFQEEGLA